MKCRLELSIDEVSQNSCELLFMCCINIPLHAAIPIIFRFIKLSLVVYSPLSLRVRIFGFPKVVPKCRLGMRDGLWHRLDRILIFHGRGWDKLRGVAALDSTVVVASELAVRFHRFGLFLGIYFIYILLLHNISHCYVFRVVCVNKDDVKILRMANKRSNYQSMHFGTIIYEVVFSWMAQYASSRYFITIMQI